MRTYAKPPEGYVRTTRGDRFGGLVLAGWYPIAKWLGGNPPEDWKDAWRA